MSGLAVRRRHRAGAGSRVRSVRRPGRQPRRRPRVTIGRAISSSTVSRPPTAAAQIAAGRCQPSGSSCAGGHREGAGGRVRPGAQQARHRPVRIHHPVADVGVVAFRWVVGRAFQPIGDLLWSRGPGMRPGPARPLPRRTRRRSWCRRSARRGSRAPCGAGPMMFNPGCGDVDVVAADRAAHVAALLVDPTDGDHPGVRGRVTRSVLLDLLPVAGGGDQHHPFGQGTLDGGCQLGAGNGGQGQVDHVGALLDRPVDGRGDLRGEVAGR